MKNLNDQENKNLIPRIKPPFLLSDLFVGIVSFIPIVNFITPLILLIRSRSYKAIKKDYFNESLSLIDLNNEKEKLLLDNDKLKMDYAKMEADLIEKYKKLESKLKQEQDNLKSNYAADIRVLEDEYNSLQNKVIVEYINDKDYSNVTSQEIKNELAMLKLNEKDLLKNNDAYEIGKALLNNKKEMNSIIKQITKCFTAEITQILNSLTLNNIEQSRSKLIKSYETTNKAFELDNIKISDEYLKLKLDELNINYEILRKIQEEKEIKQQEREMLREEEQVRREIEREKIKIEKEEKQFKSEVSKLMAYMNKSSNDAEKQLYIDKIKELEEKINLLEKDKNNVLDREQNTRAGYVYIISNIGSFGKNVYKIGMTRRLEPMDRIRELSSASVPFEFDVHAMIFSEDAPKLENILHEHFRDHAVNKINLRKEFFNIDLNEAKQVVYDNFNNTVDFTMEAKAEEYMQSLKIAN